VSLLTRVKHELREVGLVTLYFFFCFGIILLLKKLFLAAYEIEYYAISVVIVGALVAGKIVVVLDHTALGTRFAASHRPGVAALLKTLIYLGVTFLLLTGEKVFHAYRESGALGRALEDVWQNRDRNVILAKTICVSLAFVGYHLFRATDRRLGDGTLWRTIWKKL
jgi:hypothetical protein